MKIGPIDLGEKPIFLAPMEDVTDMAFRLMCKRFGADMVYTEFVSSDALVRGVGKTLRKLAVDERERPVAIQIYGRDTATMVEAARLCEEAGPDLIDLNFGCPVKRVAGKGAGAGMLQNIPLMLEITREVVKAVHLPVTVKTRLGWDKDHLVIGDLAERLQDCGIAALTIHGRTRAQMYTGEADWRLIGEVKRDPRVHIPIIGMTGHPDSLVARYSTCHLNTYVEREACPLNLAPTSSTTAALAMGDALACALMEVRHFRAQDFARFHPGGSLGRRLLTRARDVMRSDDLPVVAWDMKLGDAIIPMSEGKLGLLVAMEGDTIRGIITDGDLRRIMQRWHARFFDLQVKDVMTPNPKRIHPDMKIAEAEQLLNRYKIHSLLVVDDEEHLVGIVDNFSCML